MKYIGMIAIIAFIAIAIFGFTGFTNNHNTAFMSCINTIAGGVSCSEAGMGFLHAKIYQGFSQATVALSVLLALLSLAVHAVAKVDAANSLLFEFSAPEKSSSSLKLAHWFALQEKRDPLA